MQITQVVFTQNNTALVKVVKGTETAILEIELVETLGLQPFKVSELTVSQFDELEPMDATEDNSVSAFISNNRDSFDALHSA
jgi:hypothetical protein